MSEEFITIKEKIKLAAEHLKFSYDTLNELYTKFIEVEKRERELEKIK